MFAMITIVEDLFTSGMFAPVQLGPCTIGPSCKKSCNNIYIIQDVYDDKGFG